MTCKHEKHQEIWIVERTRDSNNAIVVSTTTQITGFLDPKQAFSYQKTGAW